MVYNYYKWNQVIQGMTKYADRKIYLYPGGVMSKEIIKLINESNVEIAGIIDRKHQRIADFETIGLDELIYDEEMVIFLTSSKYECELRDELMEVGYKGIIENFFENRSPQLQKGNSDEIFLRRMDLVLTTRCTLRCEKCANLMQYYTNPCDVKLDIILESMRRLLTVIDGIGTVYVLGGEPFIYHQLDEVIQFLKENNKVNEIRIVTNGTICPCDSNNSLWRNLSDEKVIVQISDYGELSRKKSEIINKCAKYHVNCEVEENKFFYDTGGIKKRNRSNLELEKVFADCSTLCRSLYNGELHYCPRSSHGVDLGIIKKRNEDFVDLINEFDDEILKEKVIGLLEKKDFVEACDHCDIRVAGYYEKKYPAAVQSKNVLKVEE